MEKIVIGQSGKATKINKLCSIIAFLALAMKSRFRDLGLESKPLLLNTLNLVLMLCLLLHYLDLCLVSQALCWLILWPWALSVAF